MGRLIVADELIELMIKDRDYAGENGFMDMFYERQHLIGVINKQPTAYDVDAVVQQLEKKIQTHEHCIEYEKKNGTITEEFQQRKAVEVLKDAIEIVKGGGVNAETHS